MELKRREKGFTLIEALAASAILVIIVVSAATISSHSMKRTRNNIKYQQAWQILDKQMTYIAHIGVEAFLAQDKTSGQIEADQVAGDIEYFWQVNMTDDDLDDLYDVVITISWDSGKSISASTMLNM